MDKPLDFLEPQFLKLLVEKIGNDVRKSTFQSVDETVMDVSGFIHLITRRGLLDSAFSFSSISPGAS